MKCAACRTHVRQQLHAHRWTQAMWSGSPAQKWVVFPPYSSTMQKRVKKSKQKSISTCSKILPQSVTAVLTFGFSVKPLQTYCFTAIHFNPLGATTKLHLHEQPSRHCSPGIQGEAFLPSKSKVALLVTQTRFPVRIHSIL